MIVTIHQPNFFPYYPFFQKMEESDIFVVMINCQFEKNNFQNRFNKDDRWYTMSVNKGLDPINMKRYVNHEQDWSKLKKSLFKYSKILERFDDCISENLSETNINIIHKIKDMLNIKTNIVIDYPTNLLSTDRLVDICVNNNATKYIAGISGKKYLDLEKFHERKIEVVFQDESRMIKKPILDILYEKIK